MEKTVLMVLMVQMVQMVQTVQTVQMEQEAPMQAIGQTLLPTLKD